MEQKLGCPSWNTQAADVVLNHSFMDEFDLNLIKHLNKPDQPSEAKVDNFNCRKHSLKPLRQITNMPMKA